MLIIQQARHSVEDSARISTPYLPIDDPVTSTSNNTENEPIHSPVSPKPRDTGAKYHPVVASRGNNLPVNILNCLSEWLSVLEDRGTVPGKLFGIEVFSALNLRRD